MWASLLLKVLPGPAFLWRWGAIFALFVGAVGFGAVKMHDHDEAAFDAYKERVKAAGDAQNALTQQIIQSQQRLKEISDAEAQAALRDRDSALARVRMAESSAARSRLVPAVANSAGSSGRVCYAADELDRGLRETVARTADGIIRIAEEGQRAVDVARICAQWAKN